MLALGSRLFGFGLRVGADAIGVGARLREHALGVRAGFSAHPLGRFIGRTYHIGEPSGKLLVGVDPRLRARSQGGFGLQARVTDHPFHLLDLNRHPLEELADLVRVVAPTDRDELTSADLIGAREDRKVQLGRGHGEASSTQA